MQSKKKWWYNLFFIRWWPTCKWKTESADKTSWCCQTGIFKIYFDIIIAFWWDQCIFLSTWWKYINRGGSLRSIYFHVSIKKTIYRYKKAKILLLSYYMYLKAVISHPWHHSYCSKKERMNECCLTPTQQFFSYIMARKC